MTRALRQRRPNRRTRSPSTLESCYVDATYRRALKAGATSESEPEDKPYGHRNAGVIDQNGITWWIGAPVK